MAFQSGTASSYADLQSIIETFLTGTPGYTLTSGVLTKSGTLIHVKFGNTTSQLSLEMGKGSSAGSLLHTHVTLRGQTQLVGIGDGYYDISIIPVFPITYYLFYFSSPVEMFRCVISYNNGYTQNIGLGEIVKSGPMYGGVYIDASSAPDYTNGAMASDVDLMAWDSARHKDNSFTSPLPFGKSLHSLNGSELASSTQLYAEVGGFDWWTSAQNNPGASYFDGTKFERAVGFWPAQAGLKNSLRVNEHVEPEAENCLQTHNANNVLVPVRIFGRLPNGNYMRLGDINDIRWTNIKHRNFAEIMDDGTDKWMCFPAFFKDASQVNGTSTHSGQIGYAVRYDGP